MGGDRKRESISHEKKFVKKGKHGCRYPVKRGNVQSNEANLNVKFLFFKRAIEDILTLDSQTPKYGNLFGQPVEVSWPDPTFLSEYFKIVKVFHICWCCDMYARV